MAKGLDLAILPKLGRFARIRCAERRAAKPINCCFGDAISGTQKTPRLTSKKRLPWQRVHYVSDVDK